MSEEAMGVEATEVSPTSETVETPVEAPIDHGENILAGGVEEVVVDDSPVPETEGTSSDDGVMAELARVREEVTRQKDRNDYLERMAFNNSPPAPVVPAAQAPEYDPEDLATNATVEEMVNKRIRDIENKNSQQRIVNHESEARKNHTDYDAVAIQLTTELIKGNPAKGIRPHQGLADALVASVQRGENASELAYTFGKTHPEYSSSAIANGVKDVTQKIERNMNTPQTLSNATRSQSEKVDGNFWENASDEDFEKERRRRLLKMG